MLRKLAWADGRFVLRRPPSSDHLDMLAELGWVPGDPSALGYYRDNAVVLHARSDNAPTERELTYQINDWLYAAGRMQDYEGEITSRIEKWVDERIAAGLVGGDLIPFERFKQKQDERALQNQQDEEERARFTCPHCGGHIGYKPDDWNWRGIPYMCYGCNREYGAAEDHLPKLSAHDGPWYHGTNAELQPGDMILPGYEVGKDPTHPNADYYDQGIVYITLSDYAAEKYAVRVAGRLGGDPHVYEVEPQGEVWADKEQETGWSQDQFVTGRAKVVREIDLPGNVHWDHEKGTMLRGPRQSAAVGR
jgi:predicted RNA-binding Zn-ribbon protein involved in translation (DUF1610 family)